MAWKLKKWKGSEAEEDQPSEEGVYDLSGAAPQADHAPPQTPLGHVEPEPSQAFSASALSQGNAPSPAEAPFPEPAQESASSVIALGPVETPNGDQSHDLNERTLVQPPDFAAPGAEHDPTAHASDYYEQSVAHVDETIAAFHQAASSQAAEAPVEEHPAVAEPPAAAHAPEPAVSTEAQPIEEEPIAFEIDPPGLAVAGLHERPVFSDPDIATPSAQNPPAAPAPAKADTLDAFAPYQPAPADSPAAPQQAPAHAFEDDISFAPPYTSRLVVRIGPFSATYEIDKQEYTIGRPDPKTGTSPDVALEWDDAVSRHHAVILHASDGDYLEDVGSSNGTQLNGQLIAVNTPILLKNGDVITIGERTQISYAR